MADEIKPRSIKVSDATWARWQTEAKALCVSVTALIIMRMNAATRPAQPKQPMPGPGRKGGGKASKAPKIAKAKAPASSAGSLKKAAAYARKVRARESMEAPADAVSSQTVAAREAHPRDVTASLLPTTLPVLTDFPVRTVGQRGEGKGKGKP